MQFSDVWSKYKDAYKAHTDASPSSGDEYKALTDDGRKKLESLDKVRYRAQQAVLGHPESFNQVRCWMIDVMGNKVDCDDAETVMDEMMKNADNADPNVRHGYVENFGAIATQVKKVMVQYNLTDSGGGGGGWHLGCHCTEFEAQQLCSILHVKFVKAIDAGLIEVQRKPWGLALAGGSGGKTSGYSF